MAFWSPKEPSFDPELSFNHSGTSHGTKIVSKSAGNPFWLIFADEAHINQEGLVVRVGKVVNIRL